MLKVETKTRSTIFSRHDSEDQQITTISHARVACTDMYHQLETQGPKPTLNTEGNKLRLP
uniref:Uncharacterized protein n=1 Tax=Arundo donax TaxID=35708 RepID=A0A0A9E182_ARUDO